MSEAGSYSEDDDLEVIQENGHDLEATEETNPEQSEMQNDVATQAKVVKPKRTVRNPQPKLNAETLKGKRGLIALESYFDRVKFKGKDHEEQDLSMILKTYEYWCHRLFPKYPFEECIAKIEHLGKKRPVITHLKRLRCDIYFDDEQPNVLENQNSDNEEIPDNSNNEDNFDDLLDVPRVGQQLPDVPRVEQPPPDIDEEQLERIRLSKERAERLRGEKLQQRRMEASQSSLINENSELLSDELFSQVEFSHSQLDDCDENISPSTNDLRGTEMLSEEQMEKIKNSMERAQQLRREKLRQKELENSQHFALEESKSQDEEVVAERNNYVETPSQDFSEF